jgi:carbonic anhydrase/acetyltransferase-like protein (isoleucine patch superfamily)
LTVSEWAEIMKNAHEYPVTFAKYPNDPETKVAICSKQLDRLHERDNTYLRHPNGGGWVAQTANVDPDAFVGYNAMVHDHALVEKKCVIADDAVVCGHARVMGKSKILNRAIVSGSSVICGGSSIRDRAFVGDGAYIAAGSSIEGFAIVTGLAEIRNVPIWGDSWVSQRSTVFDVEECHDDTSWLLDREYP